MKTIFCFLFVLLLQPVYAQQSSGKGGYFEHSESVIPTIRRHEARGAFGMVAGGNSNSPGMFYGGDFIYGLNAAWGLQVSGLYWSQSSNNTSLSAILIDVDPDYSFRKYFSRLGNP